jgi:hypothetical protein
MAAASVPWLGTLAQNLSIWNTVFYFDTIASPGLLSQTVLNGMPCHNGIALVGGKHGKTDQMRFRRKDYSRDGGPPG